MSFAAAKNFHPLRFQKKNSSVKVDVLLFGFTFPRNFPGALNKVKFSMLNFITAVFLVMSPILEIQVKSEVEKNLFS